MARGAELVIDRNCFVHWLDLINDQMCSGLVRKLVEEGRKAKMNI